MKFIPSAAIVGAILFCLAAGGLEFGGLTTDESSALHVADSLVYVFRQEATKRNVFIDPGLEVNIEFGDLGKYSGSCQPKSHPKTVTLDARDWKLAPIHIKEKLLFHELGHCLLGRQHDNNTLAMGECKSWMRQDGEVCKLNLINATWREYYVDELFFGDRVKVPVWYDVGRKPTDGGNLQTQSMQPKRFEFLDTALLKSLAHWKIVFEVPNDHAGVRGFSIDEYAIEYFFNDSLENRKPKITQSIVLWQYSLPEDNIFSRLVIPNDEGHIQIIFEKDKSMIFVFYNSKLQLIIPADENSLRVGGYSTFPIEQNNVNIFEL